MNLSGNQLIEGNWVAASAETFTATNPATGQALAPDFHEASNDEIQRAVDAADSARAALETAPPQQIAALLERVADRLASARQPLGDRVMAETGYPETRVNGECARTVNQTRLFADMVRAGSWVKARIDRPDLDRKPQPKPDVRSMMVGVGPVVVFGASNFPLAISVLGTDTISALAAGCPVVVKAHPGHPGTCELLARILAAAIEETGLPAGAFSLVQGATPRVGLGLVRHPATRAVAFTGSLQAGRALFDAAVARPDPIPFYAEMGSTNPIFILPQAMAERTEAIAAGFLQSVTLGVGQFCTNPGLLLGLSGPAFQPFLDHVAKQTQATKPATMLHAGIRHAFGDGVGRIADCPGVQTLAQSADTASAAAGQASCTVFTTDASTLAASPQLADEVFGPTSLVVECKGIDEMYDFARNMAGQLTASIHGTDADLERHCELVSLLRRKVGRLVLNGFPTGIEVCHAMHHGGPYPATTDSTHTSIGPAAIYRFVRPVCYQGFPDHALPPPLADANPLGLVRLVDGSLTRNPL